MNESDVRMARRLERRVLRFVAEQRLLPAGETVVLAVSGGADSLALLHIVAGNRRRLAVEVVVAYVDHGLRPAGEVAAERAFVEAQARALDLPFMAVAVPPLVAGWRRSPEEAARCGRYAALAALAGDVGAGRVATGHTASDQAETVLLRLVRGSGIRGLAAMRPEAAWPVPAEAAPRLVRPLLTVSRAETAAYCRARALAPRADPENLNPRYLRNRIRAELLPLLHALNPQIERVLTALADEAEAWHALVDGEADDGAWLTRDGGAGDLVVDVAPLAAAESGRRHARLRAALRAALPERPAPARAHLLAADRLVRGGRDAAVDLPGGRRMERHGERLRIGPRPAQPRVPEADVLVPVPGTVSWSGWQIRTRVVGSGERPDPSDRWSVALDEAAVRDLTVGRRRPGDRIELAGMSGRRRLQDLFVDEKVPRAERDCWPVFRTPRGVAWVAGLRLARWAKPVAGAAVLVTVRPGPAAQ